MRSSCRTPGTHAAHERTTPRPSVPPQPALARRRTQRLARRDSTEAIVAQHERGQRQHEPGQRHRAAAWRQIRAQPRECRLTLIAQGDTGRAIRRDGAHNRRVRVAAVYDIHGNTVALRAVLAELEREHVDLIVVGGDVVPGPLPAATIDLLRSLHGRAVYVRGNTDRWTVEEFDSRAGTESGERSVV
jgi:hypothetical protein